MSVTVTMIVMIAVMKNATQNVYQDTGTHQEIIQVITATSLTPSTAMDQNQAMEVMKVMEPVMKAMEPVMKAMEPVMKAMESVMKAMESVMKAMEPVMKAMGPVMKAMEVMEAMKAPGQKEA